MIEAARRILVLTLALGCAIARAAAPTTEQTAREHFDQGRYADAAAAWAAIATDRDATPSVLFHWARACWKAGDLEQAATLAARGRLLAPDSPDLAYLAGVVAFARGEFDLAASAFAVVAAHPGAGPLAEAARDHLDLIGWQARRDAAIQELEGGRVETARAALEALDNERPGDLMVGYHLALADFRSGAIEPALVRVQGLSAAFPDDPWTGLLLAEILLRAGQPGEAETALATLPLGNDPALIEARARVAATLAAGVGPAPTRRVEAWIQTGLALDTNPAFLVESSYVPSADRRLAGLLDLGVRWEALREPGFSLRLQPRAFLLGHAGEDEGYDTALASLSAELSARRGGARPWLGVAASMRWLDWSPFLDAEEAWAGLGVGTSPRTRATVELAAFRRAAHLEGYRNLDAFGGTLLVDERVVAGDLTLWGGWTGRLERGEEYTLGWEGFTSDEVPQPYEASLTAQASFLGQGPRAGLRWEPDWRDARLEVQGLWEWRRYGVPEQVRYEVGTDTWSDEGERSDRRGLLAADLGLRAWRSVRAFARVQAVLDRSSLGPDTWVVDRSYSRTLLSAGLEARW